LTQDYLAENMGVSPQAVSKWENDLACPDISLLPALAGFFGISIDELLTGNAIQDAGNRAQAAGESTETFSGENFSEENPGTETPFTKPEPGYSPPGNNNSWGTNLVSQLVDTIMQPLEGIQEIAESFAEEAAGWGDPELQPAGTLAQSLEGIQELLVNTRSLSCRVFLTEEPEVKFLLYSNARSPFRSQLYSTLEGNRLFLEAKTPRRIGIFFGFRREYTELYLPKQYVYDLKLQTSSGSIRMENGTLALRRADLRTLSGSIRLDTLRCENYDIRSTSGSIKFGGLTGSGLLHSTSGSLHAELLEGARHDISCTSGSIRLGQIKGRLDLHNSSGGVSLQSLEGETAMKNTSGSLSVGELWGAGSLSSVSGSVRIESLRLVGDLKLSTVSGSIRVRFAEEPSAVLEASSGSGGVHTSFAARGNRGYKTATLGQGEYCVDARTTSGSINLDIG